MGTISDAADAARVCARTTFSLSFSIISFVCLNCERKIRMFNNFLMSDLFRTRKMEQRQLSLRPFLLSSQIDLSQLEMCYNLWRSKEHCSFKECSRESNIGHFMKNRFLSTLSNAI